MESSSEKGERPKILSYFSNCRGIENEIYFRFAKTKRKDKMERNTWLLWSKNPITMYVFVSWERRKNKLFVCFLRKVKKEFYVLKN